MSGVFIISRPIQNSRGHSVTDEAGYQRELLVSR